MEPLESIATEMESFLSSPFLLLCEIAHYCLVINGVKKQWGSVRAQNQPLATWFTSMACCFGGGILVNISCGKTPLTGLTNTQSLIFATSIWWLSFYSPKSFFSTLVQWTPIAVALMVLKEMIRTRKIIKGVTFARSVYPSSILLSSSIGMLSACGGGFIKHCGGVFCNQWSKDSVQTFYLSLVTKCCLLFAFLYSLQADGLLPISVRGVALLQATVLSSVAILGKLGQEVDPFTPVERVVSSLLVDYSAFGSEAESDKMKSPKPSKKHRKDD